MARFAAEELERLKREVSLVRLVEASGVALKKHGADLLGLCPFHDDKEPSLVISPDKNLWHCLGACQAGGSVVDWVMKREGVSFRHAVALLKTGLVPAAPARHAKQSPAKHSTVKRLPPPVTFDAEDGELLRQVVAYYHEQLLASPEALDYLERRGLKHEEAIERFQLGYANRTLGLRLPFSNRRAGAEIRTRLQKLGIYRETNHEHLNGCIVVPVLSPAGEVLNLYGRRVGEKKLKADEPRHFYLPGPRRGVFNLEALRESKELILCESLFDALTFWAHGFRNVTTSYGVNGFTEELAQAITAYAVERVLVAYDRDEAGDKAAEELAKKLGAEGLGCFRVLFPKGMDANEYAVKVQPAEASLALALKSAEWMGGPTRRTSSPPQQKAAAKRKISGENVAAGPVPAVSVPAEEEPSPQPSPASGRGSRRQEQEPIPSLAASPELEQATESPPSAPPTADNEREGAPSPGPSPRSAEGAGEGRGEGSPTLPAAGEAIELVFGDRAYRVRGLERNLSYEQLKVIVRVSRGESFFLDSLDLVSARQRGSFVKQAAVDLGLKEEVIKKDLGKVHFHLEELQEALIKKTLEPKGPRGVVLTAEEAEQAMNLLQDPRLVERILEDFDLCGVVGEETNKLLGYLAAVSRKLDDPLAVIIQSSSAAGKSALMEAVLTLVPEEERISYSAMTGQSLFYMGEISLKHKLLAVAEEAGAEKASYALKLLQSEGELTIASTGKDPHSGKLVTHEYRVEGPVAIFLTTTAIEIDEELLNRCLVLTVDEDREQTRAIHRLQREGETLEGLLAKQDRERTIKLHRNAQRLLKPILVANPYARELTFLDSHTRTRRDHRKYLALIRASALLHQHQREKKTAEHHGQAVEYIEATLDDIALANRLAAEALGRSLDELPPQTRRLLLAVERLVSGACELGKIDRCDFRFRRADVRGFTGWTDFQVKVHMKKLEDLEYVLVHRGHRGQSFVYELLYEGQGQDGSPFVVGLIDVASLRRENLEGSKSKKEHRKGGLEGSRSPQVADKEPPSSIVKKSRRALKTSSSRDSDSEDPENEHQGALDLGPSYLQLAAAPSSSF